MASKPNDDGWSLSMERKLPRRTRERILELSLKLFNDFGEPNVTTTTIAEEMNISPGNLYYHFRNKDDIINSIFATFEREIEGMLRVPEDRNPNIEDVWLYLHLLFELVWRYRFFYRDMNDLLSRNRTLELHFKQILAHMVATARKLCEGMAKNKELVANATEIDALSQNMVVIGTYWLSFEYVRDPRRFNEQANMAAALGRGAYQVIAMMAPFLKGDSRRLFEKLATQYLQD
jgi:AcrR family transcriptional regulator